MRFVLALAIVVPILVGAYVLSSRPRPEPVAQTAARHAADSLTRARLEAFERLEFPAFAAALRPDGLVIAADPEEALVGGPAVVAEMEKDFGPAAARGLTLDIRPERVLTGATRRGRMAWAAADLDYGVRLGTDTLHVPLHHSAAYLLQEGEWRVMLEHDARVMTWEELREGARAGRLPAPARLGSPDGRRQESLAKRFRRWLPQLARMRPDREALAIGPSPGELAAGDSAVKSLLDDWERRLGSVRLAPDGLRAWAPRKRGVGWVAANLEASPPTWGGATLPLRFTGVYRETGEDSWRLVLAHLSVGVPDEREGVASRGR
ncbi:MAG: nuclear transport factor 2 family protein [Candidatus Eiseniibacteriota bacterium]